jgi:acyl-CoA synthetase (AMP-forming)/AMP-acid ligase II
MLDLILNNLQKFGSRNAFCINGKFYTYDEFAKAISKIRKALRDLPLETKNIGIIANDDIETYASIYAIWLEGLAYVPLHPLQPAERNEEIISQADIKVILSSSIPPPPLEENNCDRQSHI